MDRSKGRPPRGFVRPGGRAPGRRPPPPDATGDESRELTAWSASGAAVVVRLLDGRSVSGRVAGFDRDQIQIDPPDGASVFLRKDSIRTIEED